MMPGHLNVAFTRPISTEVVGGPAPVLVRRLGLGDAGTDVAGFFSNIFGTITGANAQAAAQANALELARINAARAETEAQYSTQLWSANLPYIVAGGVAVVGLIVYATRK